MKLTIKKLGRIQSAEIDIRPLTVFIGPNSTNKTWVAYLLYGYVQILSQTMSSESDPYSPTTIEENQDFWELLRKMISPVLEALTAEPAPVRVECSLGVRQLLEKSSPDRTLKFDAPTIGQFLGMPPQRVEEASTSFEFQKQEFTSPATALDVVFERSLNRLQIKVTRRRSAGESESSETTASFSYVDDAWTEQKILNAVWTQLHYNVDHVIVFPAERNALLSFWSLLNATSRAGTPFPVSDFSKFLGVAQTSPTATSMSRTQNQLLVLLRNVTGGEIAYTSEGERKYLVFRSGKSEVPIQAAASLSRALAGLSLYVERFFQPGDVLIIDELEMNAHPQAQIALTEFIAALVNSGIRVVFTTHSPYIVDHLNNLMEASRAPAAKQAALAEKFALRTTSSFISPEKVAVHAFEEDAPGGNVSVRDVLNRDTGLIDWSTFSRVSEHIANLYGDILRASEDDA